MQYRDWETQHRPWFHQPIIGISAHANMNDRGQGIRAGMDDFSPKPITVKTLTQLQQCDECLLRTEQLDRLEQDQRTNSVSDGSDTVPFEHLSVNNGVEQIGTAGDTVCLLATDPTTTLENGLQRELQSHGWCVVAVSDGTDCLRLLQMRNWDVVLIDDDLQHLPGASCIGAFREWEGKNRVNRQKNVYLMCEGDIPSPVDGQSLVHSPEGCNGVVGRPVRWTDLQFLMQPKEGDRGMDIVAR